MIDNKLTFKKKKNSQMFIQYCEDCLIKALSVYLKSGCCNQVGFSCGIN